MSQDAGANHPLDAKTKSAKETPTFEEMSAFIQKLAAANAGAEEDQIIVFTSKQARILIKCTDYIIFMQTAGAFGKVVFSMGAYVGGAILSVWYVFTWINTHFPGLGNKP